MASSIATDKNFDVTLYSPDDLDSEVFRSKPVFKNIFEGNIINKFTSFYSAYFKSLSQSKKENVSIIHLHFFGLSFTNLFNLIFAKFFFNYKTIVTIHDIENFDKKNRNILNYILKPAFVFLIDGIIVHTQFSLGLLKKKFGKYLFNKIQIEMIYGFDLDYTQLNCKKNNKISSRKRLGLPIDKKIILFFGQIKRIKNLELIIKALSKIREEDSNIVLVIAGKIWKDDFKFYQDLIDKFNLEQNIIKRIEFINNEDVQYYFHASDLFILPYRIIYNSGVLVKGMSYSCPVLCSDLPVFKEFINDGHNGFLFTENNISSLKNKILKIFENDTDLDLIGLNGKNTIIKRFNFNEISSKYTSFYKNVLSK